MYIGWAYNKEKARNILIESERRRKEYEEKHPNPDDVTYAQYNFITEIEEVVEDKFSGTTKKEASNYISSHIEEFKEKKRRNQ